MDGFGDVFGLDRVGAFEVGDGAGDFQDAVVGAGAEALLGHGAFEQAFAIGGERACGADASGTLNRADYGITYGDKYGFKMDVKLAIQVEAMRAS